LARREKALIDTVDMPAVAAIRLPALTAAQMAEVDRIMIEDLDIQLHQMMENAGRNLADLTMRRFDPRTVIVLAGSGGNGGGGITAARHLANRGVEVVVVLGQDRAAMGEVPGHQLDIVERLGVRISDEPEDGAVAIDALIGYSLKGEPRGRIADLIRWALSQSAPVLALDTPSGLDVTSGRAADPCIAAAATMTLAMPKVGLLAAPQVGELYLADISVPPFVYEQMGLKRPDGAFAEGTVVRVTTESS
jgi:NAD(P)H-hydrate epimerase